MKRKTPRISLSVYRLKAPIGRTPFDDVIADDHASEVESVPVDLGEEVRAQLFTKRNDPRHPLWARFLEPAVPNIRELLAENAANSAVLVIDLGPARYALVFGYGRALISPSVIERGFGLRCALALIDPASMISVGYKQVDHTTLFADLQTNRLVRFDEFHVDIDAAILSGVGGKPEVAHAYYTHALGSDALYVNPKIKARGLPKFLNWVEQVYQDRGYVDLGYDWIDHVLIVRDRAELDGLHAAIDTSLRRGSRKIDVGPPEPIDYKRVDGFKIVGEGRTTARPEVKIGDIARVREVRQLTLDEVKATRIRAVDADGAELESWNAFDWLTWTGKVGGASYILQAGTFFKIERSFEKKIDRALRLLDPLPDGWPDWEGIIGNEPEADYNELLAEHFGDRGKLLDKVMFAKTFQGKGRLELCDVFLRAGRRPPAWLICVKKYLGSSAELSHLFAQGMNSVMTLLADEDFRVEVREQDLESDVPLEAPASEDFGVAYLILTRQERIKIQELPFFAKLTLYRHMKEAQQRGIALRVGTRAMVADAAIARGRRGPLRADSRPAESSAAVL